MTTTADQSNLSPVAVGSILAGKYEVERVLGSGGMGVVVAAKHVLMGERVAIKFLLSHAMKKKEVVQRFEQEGRAAARIKSEHVGRVFDVARLEDGSLYMVMELLDGADLSTVLKTKGAVPYDVAVEYVLQACEAIAEAHSIGIIHRDLKPANLFVTKRADGSPVVKVIDFGISKMADPSEGENVELTKTDVMMGSPVYMAPEQMISARDVDVRADVWSLGVILYYLIMGAQPFKGQSVTQLYASILEGPPSMRATRPDIPEALDAAVQKCLLAVPKERWANVAEFALAIAAFGPAHARVSAERVARTLGVAPKPPTSNPPPPSVTPGSVTPPAVASTGTTGAGAAGEASASTGPHTDGSWGGTQGPVARKRSRAVIAVAAVAVLGVAGVGVTLLLRHGSTAAQSGAAADASSGVVAAGSVTITPSGTVVPVTPVVVAPSASTGVATVAVAPSQSASVAPTAATAPVVSKPQGGTARPPVTAKPVSTKPKGGGDLFSDPH
jgi:serine/threonine-protein kinase